MRRGDPSMTPNFCLGLQMPLLAGLLLAAWCFSFSVVESLSGGMRKMECYTCGRPPTTACRDTEPYGVRTLCWVPTAACVTSISVDMDAMEAQIRRSQCSNTTAGMNFCQEMGLTGWFECFCSSPLCNKGLDHPAVRQLLGDKVRLVDPATRIRRRQGATRQLRNNNSSSGRTLRDHLAEAAAGRSRTSLPSMTCCLFQFMGGAFLVRVLRKFWLLGESDL